MGLIMFKKKNNDNVFIETKKQPIKFKGYKFIGYHSDWAVGYYIRKCDNLNNCNFMEVKIAPDRTIDAGTKVSIIGNNKKGRIYIDYYSQDDLDRIYDTFLR